jgi:hypothetical protein
MTQVISRGVGLPVLMDAVSPLGMPPEQRCGDLCLKMVLSCNVMRR